MTAMANILSRLSKLDYETLRLLKPSGPKDARMWGAFLGGAAINHPAIDDLVAASLPQWLPVNPSVIAAIAGATLSCWGAKDIYHRMRPFFQDRFWDVCLNERIKQTKSPLDAERLENLRSKVFVRSSDNLPTPISDELLHGWRTWNGVHLGYCVDSGKPIVIDYDKWMRHCFIIGQSGVGKTVLGEWLMFQQIVRGGGLIFIDGKLDEGNLKKIHAMATWAGRRDDLLVVNPGKPEQSNTYNPILIGDADEVSARILSPFPSTENNPGADHYRQQANQAITTVINGLKSIPVNSHLKSIGIEGMAYNFFDLQLMLQNQKALEFVLDKINRRSPGGQQFLSWLEQFKSINKDGITSIDIKKMKDTFGGIGGRMHSFGTGKFGKVTGSYYPEVNLYEAIMSNKIVYIALPTMGKAEAASNFGKMAVGDYRTAVSWLQDTPKHLRPWPPTLCFFDEAGSYVTPAWARIFEQARSAHQVLVPAVQTLANLEAVSPELKAMVMGNTLTKVIFKLGEGETVQQIADFIGTDSYRSMSVGYTAAESESGQDSAAVSGSSSASAGRNITFRETEEYRVKPTTLSGLGQGEAIVYYDNSEIYHIRIPMLSFDESFYKEIGPFEVARRKPRRVAALDFASRLDRFITD
jgi:intracellular multiplication protein IcmO